MPANYWYERDPSWAGEDFVIRERVEGDTNFRDLSAGSQRAILDHFVELLAIQHNLDWESMGLAFLGTASGRPRVRAHGGRALGEGDEAGTARTAAVMTATMAWLSGTSPRRWTASCWGRGRWGRARFSSATTA